MKFSAFYNMHESWKFSEKCHAEKNCLFVDLHKYRFECVRIKEFFVRLR